MACYLTPSLNYLLDCLPIPCKNDRQQHEQPYCGDTHKYEAKPIIHHGTGAAKAETITTPPAKASGLEGASFKIINKASGIVEEGLEALSFKNFKDLWNDQPEFRNGIISGSLVVCCCITGGCCTTVSAHAVTSIFGFTPCMLLVKGSTAKVLLCNCCVQSSGQLCSGIFAFFQKPSSISCA